MTWKRFWIYTAIAVVCAVIIGFLVVQTNGGLDNPDLLCDIALRHSDCN